MKEETLPTKKPSASASLLRIWHTLARYTTLWFALLLVAVYGFVLFRIQAAQSATPSTDDVSSQLQATTTPHVDPQVVSQMQSLQDHSVNVKTLFDQARDNPFKE